MLVMHATKENNAFNASDSQYSKIQLFNPAVFQSSEQLNLEFLLKNQWLWIFEFAG